MKLIEKEFIKKDGTKIKLTPEWISSKLGEVYELSCLDDISGERLHYGYMTEALVAFLETTDKDGTQFFERIKINHREHSKDRVFNLLNQKIILDKYPKPETEDFREGIWLWPTVYSEEKKIDDIAMKADLGFSLCNERGDLELYFNDNMVEIKSFEYFNSEEIKAIYNFNFEDNQAGFINISKMNNPHWSNDKALDNIDLAFEAKKGANITLHDSTINMMINDNENFTFAPIKVGCEFVMRDSQITFDRKSLNNKEVELDVDFFYLAHSSISFESKNNSKVGLYLRGTTTINDIKITCIDFSTINKTFSAQTIGGETQEVQMRLENATINSGIAYYSNIKYDSSIFEIVNSTIENENEQTISLSNGIIINNSTIKNTLKLTNTFIENVDIDNLVLENKGQDSESFLITTTTVDGDRSGQGRVALSNCAINIDNCFSINIHGNFSASNSIFNGENHFYSSLERMDGTFVKGDVNQDVEIINSSFKNAEIYAIGLNENKNWQDLKYRQKLVVCGSEIGGENFLRETALVENSVLQNVNLANAKEVKDSFLKDFSLVYHYPGIIEKLDSAAEQEPQNGIIIGKNNEDFEAL